MIKSFILSCSILYLTTSLIIDSYGQEKVLQSGNETLLILTKKSDESKKHSFKPGDRIKILTKEKEEKKGKITHIELNYIHLKKENIAIEDIYSISKKSSPGAEVIGGIIGGAGMIILFGSVSPPSSMVGQNIKTEALLSGGLFTATAVLLLYRKNYSHRKWSLEVINNK